MRFVQTLLTVVGLVTFSMASQADGSFRPWQDASGGEANASCEYANTVARPPSPPGTLAMTFHFQGFSVDAKTKGIIRAILSDGHADTPLFRFDFDDIDPVSQTATRQISFIFGAIPDKKVDLAADSSGGNVDSPDPYEFSGPAVFGNGQYYRHHRN